MQHEHPMTTHGNNEETIELPPVRDMFSALMQIGDVADRMRMTQELAYEINEAPASYGLTDIRKRMLVGEIDPARFVDDLWETWYNDYSGEDAPVNLERSLAACVKNRYPNIPVPVKRLR